jgi:rhodanese-related sulfurtransferase
MFKKLKTIIMGLFSFATKKAETDLSPQEFKQKMEADQDAVLLDVRTSGEVAEGVIQNAQHIDFFSPNFRSEASNLPKDKNYYVYCRSGNRSGQAVSFLKSQGYNAYNLSGGIMSWSF